MKKDLSFYKRHFPKQFITSLYDVNPLLLPFIKGDLVESNLFKNLYGRLVKPSLKWSKIKNSLREININDETIKELVFKLKPLPIEHIIIEYKNFYLPFSTKGLRQKFNKTIKELSLTLGKLKKLQEEYGIFKKFNPLSQTIKLIESEIYERKNIVKELNLKPLYKDIFSIDKDILKSPQKHKYWNSIVSVATEILNPYFHTGSCSEDSKDNINCRKTHEKTYMKIAELLKILYPSIWKESVNKIASRIKQKNYRGI